MGWIEWELRHRDEVLRHLQEAARITRQEPGCLSYVVAVAPEQPRRVHLFELWRSMNALDEHLRTTHVAEFRRATAGFARIGRSLNWFVVSAAEPM